MPDPLILPAVPILGQSEPTPYPIGGHALGFTVSPEQVAETHRQALQQGLQPDVGFVLLWQRTAIAVNLLAAQNNDLRERCTRLEAALGIEPSSAEAMPLTMVNAPKGSEENIDDGK